MFAEIPDPLWTRPEDPDSLAPASRVHQPLRAEPVDVPQAVYPAPQVLAEDPRKNQPN